MTTDTPRWGLARRVLFRFVFAYVGLYVAQALPVWDGLVTAVGRGVFGTTVDPTPTSSGDMPWNYVQLFCVACLAAALAAVWSLLDRRRPAYDRLHGWLRLGLRMLLATVMVFYGAAKVIKAQFPAPAIDRLMDPVGDMSPMGLLWAFMGYSEPYTAFTGAAEMAAGFLLVARRTALLGAVLTAAVSAQVVALNYCYDVPVKLFSTHLLAFSLVLLAPDLRRLADLFVFARRPEAVEVRRLLPGRWPHRAGLALRTGFVALVAAAGLVVSSWMREQAGDGVPNSPLYGVWEVEGFVTDGRERPPLTTDAGRWRYVVFGRAGTASVLPMEGRRLLFGAALDEAAGTMTLARQGTEAVTHLRYERPEPDRLTLTGALDGKPLRASLRRTERHFLLTSRGFHWVNDRPFNY